MKRAISSLVVSVLVLSLAVGCGGDDGAVSAGPVPSNEPSPETTVEPAAETATSPSSETTETDGEAAAATRSYEVWFVQGNALVETQRDGAATEGVAAEAVRLLLAGPVDPSHETAIPGGTRLLGIDIDDGIATVDLTSEFESGGGSHGMFLRLGQVVYTVTQFPTVDAVRFHLDGEPVDVFSAEGIVLDEPVTREDYENLQPMIVVESPASGADVSSPITVTGRANVFEANVTLRILDSQRREIAKTFTTATCGSGCWGSFRGEIAYRVSSNQQGWLVVQDDDADGDGKPSHQVTLPVTLTAG